MAPARDTHQRKPAAPLPVSTGGHPDHTALILVGLDGSDTSWDAFCWACGEAQRLRGRVVAVFVTPAVHSIAAAAAIPGVVVCDYPSIDGAAARAAQLQDQALQSAAGRGLNLAFVHRRGDAATELLRIAKAVDADQIVVGKSTRRRRRLAGALGRRLMANRGAPIIVIVP